jgi:YesN/AraC family two-component response regulator
LIDRVLIVDDDCGTLQTFALALRLDAFDVTTAATGHDALHALRPAPDAIVCDLNLPDMSGLDVIGALRRRGVVAPCIVITGFASTASALAAGKLGVASYLEKPVATEDLVALLRTEIDSARAHPGVAADSHPTRVQRVIEQRFAEPDLDLQTVSTAVGISAQHVSRVTKRRFGITFSELLRGIRLQEARRLLRGTSASIKEIAFRVGFRHPSQFTRTFRDLYGRSPSQFRGERGDHVAKSATSGSDDSDDVC